MSIRDLVKQILCELKYLQCKNIPEGQKISIKKTNRFYELELLEEKKLQEKYGMDIFFTSNIGLVGIYFLTPENRNQDIKLHTNQYNYHILEIDLSSMQNLQRYTIDILKNIIENPYLKRFSFSSSHEESPNLKAQKDYERFYQSKSIMNMEDFRAIKMSSILINSFEHSDFSAINVAKLYYQNMLNHFKDNEVQDDCKELHVDKVHGFYQYKNQYYATATIRDKYHVYQVLDNVIVLIGKCFKKEEITQIIQAHSVEVNDEYLEREVPIKNYPSLF